MNDGGGGPGKGLARSVAGDTVEWVPRIERTNGERERERERTGASPPPGVFRKSGK